MVKMGGNSLQGGARGLVGRNEPLSKYTGTQGGEVDVGIDHFQTILLLSLSV